MITAGNFDDGNDNKYTVNYSAHVKVTDFGLQKGTTRTVYVKWSWTMYSTKEYRVVWYYYTDRGKKFLGQDSSVTIKQSTYNAPSNAISVQVKILPISTEITANGKKYKRWTAKWSTAKTYYFKNNPPSTPSTPTVTIEDYRLTASLANIKTDTTEIEWYIVRNDKTKFYSIKTKVNKTAAAMSCTVNAGGRYKVRCRAWRGTQSSEWSEYSNNEETIPEAVKEITRLEAFSETGIIIGWENVDCTKYEVQYTTVLSYFDSNPEENKAQTIESIVTHAELSSLETGYEYFFRVRAVNDHGNSAWSTIRSIILGKDPTAPTTWSSTTTAIVGEELILYWVHNATDGSSEKQAELELNIDGTVSVETIPNTATGDEKDKTKSKNVDTSKWGEGTTIKWRVRTMGVTGKYGDWSVQRIINIYAPATLQLNVTDFEGNEISTLKSFPFYIKGIGGPTSQKVLGYHVSIIALDAYETIDETGTGTVISKGQEIFSKYYDISGDLLVELSAGNIDLENNIKYRVICSVSMNSGLSAEQSMEFDVGWKDETYSLNAEMAYDPNTYSFVIRPYCLDENDELVSDVALAVYRRQFDGELIEIASGIENSWSEFVTDPHPALDFGRYRIVAKTISTGAISYYDLPGYPINESGIIIQWNEEWENYVTSELDENAEPVEPSWSGSLIHLPYNVDVSDDNDLDVSLVEYIGREHPVSYYGTQVGQTSNWKTDVPKTDTDTIYALRRLSVYKGDVYARESGGSGYWANVSVSYSRTHNENIIPVTIKVTRVEGGI